MRLIAESHSCPAIPSPGGGGRGWLPPISQPQPRALPYVPRRFVLRDRTGSGRDVVAPPGETASRFNPQRKAAAVDGSGLLPTMMHVKEKQERATPVAPPGAAVRPQAVRISDEEFSAKLLAPKPWPRPVEIKQVGGAGAGARTLAKWTAPLRIPKQLDSEGQRAADRFEGVLKAHWASRRVRHLADEVPQLPPKARSASSATTLLLRSPGGTPRAASGQGSGTTLTPRHSLEATQKPVRVKLTLPRIS
eukprot:TRINITY_DN33593_c0_g1_i3.p2 TRINITY_DN33593_c0_g1~~TRINITY_DN33593_c0_g1_i3.p2  ORF type:complete len:249 (-),score=37.47 TRINITY_DN33593_c0_g1_i3:379-1125(-)